MSDQCKAYLQIQLKASPELTVLTDVTFCARLTSHITINTSFCTNGRYSVFALHIYVVFCHEIRYHAWFRKITRTRTVFYS